MEKRKQKKGYVTHKGGRLIQCGHSSVQLHTGQIYYLGVLILQKSLKQALSIANII